MLRDVVYSLNNMFLGYTMNDRQKMMNVWRAMHNRCENPKNKSYSDYGGRGIYVEAVWHGRDGFERFLKDMGERPAGGTIDRKDNSGPYGPSNCQWATRSEQNSNKRTNRWITANGVTKTMAQWAKDIGCNPATILQRIKSGMEPHDAVLTPVVARPNAKLTSEQVTEMRATYPQLTFMALAKKYNVSKKTVMNVIHMKIYRDVSEGAEV